MTANRLNRFAKTAAVTTLFTALFAAAPAAHAIQVRVSIENLAPPNGIILTPAWVAFHDGTFDTYDAGQPASTPLGGDTLERLAEDGNTAPITAAFAASPAGVAGGIDATIATSTGIPPIEPGETASQTFNLDPSGINQYFSYVSMLIPSNDAFIANGNPLAHEIFDNAGNFLGADFFVLGQQTNDAGTEVNDEAPANTAAFGQMAPNTGVDENGVVISPHPGLMPIGSGGILDDPNFANADFLNYADDRIVRITITQVVPEPMTAGLSLMGLTTLGAALRRRRRV